MDPRSIIAIFLVALFVWHQTSRDYERGLCWGVFFLVWMPHAVRVEVPGAIPEFTIHRVILLVLIASGMAQGKFQQLSRRVPLFGLLLAMFISYTVSMIFAMDSGMAFKRLFGTLFESYLLYIAIVCGSWNWQHVERLLKFALMGILFVAFFAPLEYYIGLNVIGKFLPISASAGGVISTYEHNIHFGYITAMAIPLALVFSTRATNRTESWFYFLGLGILLAACYVSFSRGALLAGILAVAMILVLGGRPLRKMALIMGTCIALALLVRPGVRETVFDMIDSTLPHQGEEDASAEYRKVLWVVAYTKISDSPIALAFGLGGGSTMLMDISSFFGRQRGGQVMEQGFSSWDSQWAANLAQYGFLGLGIEVLIWIKVFRVLRSSYFRPGGDRGNLLIFAIFVGCAVWLWAMLTVAMFSPQLKYLVSTIIACGIMLSHKAAPSPEFADPE